MSNFCLDTVASRRRSTGKSYYDNVLNSSKISNVQVMSSDEMRRNRVQDLPNDNGQAQRSNTSSSVTRTERMDGLRTDRGVSISNVLL